jgi:hypothetical protein
MKKFVIAALAIGAMAACTKSNVKFEQPGEISFQPVAQKATKAAVDGTVYPVEENFKVWAWWDDATPKDNPTYADYKDYPYISAGKFIHRDAYNWGGETPYYWPTSGSLVFAGYSPADANATSFGYSVENQEFTVGDYIQDTDISKTNDLMWFDVMKSYLKNPGGAEDLAKGVPVVFKHALSWLTFNFVLDSEITNHKWEVTGVILKQVNTKADFTSTKLDNYKWDLSEDDADMKDMTVYAKSSGATAQYITTTSTKYENVDNGVVVIPQSCVKLLVKYNLTASTGVVIPQEVTLDLTAGTDGTAWLPGKHYVYTVVFGANEILVSPSVCDWEDVPVDNIPVQ